MPKLLLYTRKPKVSIIWYTVILHLLWGFLLIGSSDPTHITAIATSASVVTNSTLLGLIYVVSALMATLSLYVQPVSAIGLLFPQHLLLQTSAFGAVTAMITGTFADGVVRSSPFLVTDQAPSVIIAILHLMVITNLLDDLIPDEKC